MSEQPPQTNTNPETPNPEDRFDDIRDLIDVGADKNGDGVNTLHASNGDFLSVDELEMIREHQDLIRGKKQEETPADIEDERDMDADRDNIIADYIHHFTDGNGTSPERVKKLYKMLEEEPDEGDDPNPTPPEDEPPEGGDDGDDGGDEPPENPDEPEEPDEPNNPDDDPSNPEPQVPPRFTAKELQKQQAILKEIDDADRIFDRHKRMVALKGLAEKYKEIEFAGDTGTLGVEAAQRIRKSKTRSKWNPRRLWVQKRKKANYLLSQMAYDKNGTYSLDAAKAMGDNTLIANKVVYPHRNETIHRTNKWFDSEYIPGLKTKIDSLNNKFATKQQELLDKQQEIQNFTGDDKDKKRLEEQAKKLNNEVLKTYMEIVETQDELDRKQHGALDALATLRGFGGNEYFGKGIAYLAITRNDPGLLYALEALDRTKLPFSERTVDIPLAARLREAYHKTRIEKSRFMMIPQQLKKDLETLALHRQQGTINQTQHDALKIQVVNDAKNRARNIPQPDWRDHVLLQISEIVS